MKHAFGIMLVVSLAGFMLLVIVLGVQAGYELKWGSNGVPISAVGGDQRSPLLVSDSSGAIISWIDGRTGLRGRIYAQRVWANGQVAWTPNGVFAISSTREIQKFSAIDDGQYGAFIVWEDYGRGEGWPIGDLMAQHMTANGVPLWATTGLTISARWPDDEEIGGLISDGAGGAIVAWNEYDGPNEAADVYVQRFNATGALQWGSSGVRLIPLTGYQTADARIATDQQHGAYVVYRNPNNQVKLQRILANGNPVWAGGGLTLTPDPIDAALAIVADGSGGVIVRWGNVSQRVLSAGTVLWGASGVTLTDLSVMNIGAFSPLLADEAGGVYVAWEDRQLITPTIRAQHVLSSGLLGWPVNGITITNDGIYPTLVGDGYGGVIALWRNYPEYTGHHSCWAQQIDADGDAQWTTLIITASTSYFSTTTCAMVSDLYHGAIVAWRDWRNGVDGDIYAQHLSDFAAKAWIYLPMIRK